MPLIDELRARAFAEPMNLAATVIFLLAIVHTFLAARVTHFAHDVQHRHDAASDAAGRPRTPNVLAGFLHFFGEVEVVFGLWVVPLIVMFALERGLEAATRYLDETVVYTEPLFVIVIMALASTRPVVAFAEASLRRIAAVGGATPAAWWLTILIVAPLLGSLITEPGAMTVAALLLARQFYDLQPGLSLRYATLGLLFVNISIGGTLTHFAAPPVLMVARTWNWDMAFMLSHFGWRAIIAIVASTACYYAFYRRELQALALRAPVTDVEQPDEDAGAARALLPVPAWITAAHLLFMAWTVFTAHHSALFLGGFLFFLGFVRATAAYQSRLDLRAPLLVGFFLAGLVIHGGLQAWWITPVLAGLGETSSFVASTILTSFNDNALITYLATLVPNLSQEIKMAVVEGAVTGGGLTVIANAPNPAGQALLARFFDGAVQPLRLFLAALVPTLIAAAAFRLI
jgi:hypothetical protein